MTWKMTDCVHWPEKKEGKCPWEDNSDNCNNCQDYHVKRKIDYNDLPMEEFEKIAVYDLGGQVLNDCTYLSSKAVVEAVELWWKRSEGFIMDAVLEKVRSSGGTQS